jgi:hypothetical protein
MYGLHSSVVTSPLLKKKTCQERSAPMLGFVFPIRGVRRERERGSTWEQMSRLPLRQPLGFLGYRFYGDPSTVTHQQKPSVRASGINGTKNQNSEQGLI